MSAPVLPVLLSVGLLLVAAGAGGQPPRVPTVAELEVALDASATEGYGAAGPEPAHRLFLRMEPSDVPDHLLLAVLLAGATRGSPVDVAQQVLLRADGDITRLSRKSIYESTPGVGPAGRARIGAATELARRIDYRRVAQSADPIMSPDQAAAILATVSVGPYEKLSALYLDRRHRPLGTRLVTVGNDSLTVVDPRQIFRYAMELGASSVILAHQHPSGDPSPSYQDIDVTKRVMSAGRILGIRLLDHLVIGNTGNWVSMATRGELPDWGPSDPMSITSR